MQHNWPTVRFAISIHLTSALLHETLYSGGVAISISINAPQHNIYILKISLFKVPNATNYLIEV